jgi:ribonuclease T
MSDNAQFTGLCDRFRGFYPVVIDVETAGFNAKTDALLEIAAITLKMDEQGWLTRTPRCISTLNRLRGQTSSQKRWPLTVSTRKTHCAAR